MNKSKSSKTIINTQVYDPKGTLTSNGFTKKFCDRLQTYKCRPRLTIRKHYKEVDKTAPLFVLCNQGFRLGTDIDTATREMVNDDGIRLMSVAVVVVHEKDEHALTNVLSRNALLDEKYDKFGLIVDIAFGTNGEIYKCSMNNEGFGDLEQFILQFAKQEEKTCEELKTVNLKPKSSKTIINTQVYDPKGTLTSNGFTKTFCDRLQTYKCRPRLTIRKHYKEVDKTAPLLVLCNQGFRLGTDIDTATREMVNDDGIRLMSVAVVVVHEKDEHALTNVLSRNALLDEKYDKFGLIVDIAFGTNGEIYKCSMNNEGFGDLEQFILQFAKQEEKTCEELKTVSLKPKLQVYHHCDSTRTTELSKVILQKLEGCSELFDVVELISVLDRDVTQPLVAVVEAQSQVHKEFMLSKETPKHATILFILKDDCYKPEIVGNGKLQLVWVNENSQETNPKYFQDVLESFTSSFDDEWTVVVQKISKKKGGLSTLSACILI